MIEINGEQVERAARYADLGLSEALMKAVDKKGYVEATPIQARGHSLLHGLEGRHRQGPPPARARPLPSASPWWSTSTRRARASRG